MNVIQCRDVTKSYGQNKALDRLSFEIGENKITGFIGRNGAGKTTLLKMIAGYIKPTQGELQVFSRKPFNNLDVSAKTIFIDDNMTFPDSFRLTDILSEVASFYAAWNSNLAIALFNYFSFDPNQAHSNLSKGSKSTFNSIIGIASRCPLTILDEPTTGMDSAVRKDFYKALLKDYLEHPRTILLSSHLLSELEEILEDILLIDNGSKCLHLPVMELRELAVGIRGNEQALLTFVEGKELIYKEEFAKGSLYVVIKKELIEQEFKHVRQNGLEVLPISTDDLCVYLTGKTGGGIDDVFKRG
ncbi:ATP-binding cassette domain-containing protein [Desulfosporosinus nitroreducens]|uniref:ABC transporter ATP-binding protein n=1 Tax=Desulfosporosinus nitroreducens TaxID=2018668 RepID=A0ABT8QK26_9FIRM|nr:ABC transporter ATP-binding protein [Desulfosporosinus nitroreducens]MCO1601175.1 ABC transporter ATP-binding protein [Desulfosporosinus nitroreducens]MDO0821679.1 ABC transporter ATP-binding protein [Desulfosporosinus nitroreducens]